MTEIFPSLREMEHVLASLESINVRADECVGVIAHDARLILRCQAESSASVPRHLCKMQRALYPNCLLYADLVTELTRAGRGADLLELMPYVDDYLGHFW